MRIVVTGAAGRFGVVLRAELASTGHQVIAPRPQFCALSNRKLLALGINMPSWQSAIMRHVAARRADVPVGAASP